MQVCEHQLGRQCRRCGHVAVPARYYMKGPAEYVSREDAVDDQRQALKRYCEETGREYGPAVIVPETGTDVPVSQVLSQKVCDGCSQGFEGYGKKCEKCRKRAQRAK